VTALTMRPQQRRPGAGTAHCMPLHRSLLGSHGLDLHTRAQRRLATGRIHRFPRLLPPPAESGRLVSMPCVLRLTL
jgi:hypothetical protein